MITINALLCQAALMDGLRVLSYDQTGAAQKWGPVLSSLVIAASGEALAANKVGLGRADLYLALDLLAAASRANLDRCDPARTVAVINTSLLPSGEMVRDVRFTPPSEAMWEAVARFSRSEENVSVDARLLAEGLFGDYMATNMFALGVAYQSGLLPLTAQGIEGAIHLNGVQVAQNLQAFRYGRLYVADPERVRALVETPPPRLEDERARALARLRPGEARAYTALLDRCAHLDEEARRMLAIRVAELIEYQDTRYPGAYVDTVLRVAARERAALPGRCEITHAVIRGLYKLMAYKDEYEVARLHASPAFHQETRALFAAPRRVVYNLHPPLMRALGLTRKLQLGPWFTPALTLLRELRRLRGTPWDVFGYAAVRREERRLIAWYRALVEAALDRLDAETFPVVLEIADLPDAIRGYEEIKLRNIRSVTERAAALRERLGGARVPAGVQA